MSLKLKKKRIPIVIGMGVGTIFAAYAIFCLCVGSGDFLSNTTINGIDVSGMTKQEAIDKLSEQYEKDKKKLLISVDLDNKEYSLDFRSVASFNVEEEITNICDFYKPFLYRGIRYFDNEKTIGVSITDEEEFHKIVEDSHILEYSSLIPTSYEIKEDSVEFTKGVSGFKFDSTTAYNQIHSILTEYRFKEDIELETVEAKEDESTIDALEKKISNAAKNATLDKKNNYSIVAEKYGAEFDSNEAKKLFNRTKEGESFTVSAKLIAPEITKEKLKANLYKDVLGTYTTYVSGSSVRKNNVRLAGSKCNLTLLPGEEFSYNNVVGKRTTAAGFGAAGAYLNGETVQEVGGGICQASSTIYNAVVLSNLEVTERHCHTYQSSYVPIGRDATVSWGGPDFRFKNNTSYPIKIVTSYANDRITCKIIGTNLDGHYVNFTSEKTSTIPFSEKREKDNTIEKGKEVIKEHGSNGARAVSYRYVYDKNGKLISKNKESSSYYRPHNRIILVGTKKPEEKPNNSDNENKKPDSENDSEDSTTVPENEN